MTKSRVCLFLLLISLMGCSTINEYSAQSDQPANFPANHYQQADSNHVYRIDSDLSQIIISVRRGGLMAKLGHDHIVASHHVQGFILLDQMRGQCRADFFAPLVMLEVDNPELRAAAAMATKPTDAEIVGTRSNMLKSLEAELFPFAQLQSRDCIDALGGNPANIHFDLHGVVRSQKIAVSLDQSDDSQLLVTSNFSILQSDYGIEPFSIMNGLIRVEDRLDISVQLVAKRARKE